jgi:hypothetical protein
MGPKYTKRPLKMKTTSYDNVVIKRLISLGMNATATWIFFNS